MNTNRELLTISMLILPVNNNSIQIYLKLSQSCLDLISGQSRISKTILVVCRPGEATYNSSAIFPGGDVVRSLPLLNPPMLNVEEQGKGRLSWPSLLLKPLPSGRGSTSVADLHRKIFDTCPSVPFS